MKQYRALAYTAECRFVMVDSASSVRAIYHVWRLNTYYQPEYADDTRTVSMYVYVNAEYLFCGCRLSHA